MSMTTFAGRPGPSIWTPGYAGLLELIDIDVDQNTGSFCLRSTASGVPPEQSAPLSMIHPIDETAQIQMWTLYVQRLIERLRVTEEVPNDYRAFTLDSDTDWSGDPIVIVKLLFDSNGEVSESKIGEWNILATIIQRHLIRLFNATTPPSSPYRFPFVNVGEAPKEEYATSR